MIVSFYSNEPALNTLVDMVGARFLGKEVRTFDTLPGVISFFSGSVDGLLIAKVPFDPQEKQRFLDFLQCLDSRRMGLIVPPDDNEKSFWNGLNRRRETGKIFDDLRALIDKLNQQTHNPVITE